MLSISNNSLYAFLLLCIIFLLIGNASQFLLVNDALYLDNFTSQMDYGRAIKLLNSLKRYDWLSSVILPILFLIKLSIITSCLTIGYFLFFNKLHYNIFFLKVILAEFIFIIPIFIKIIWFLFIHTDYTLGDLNQFHPISVLNILDGTALPNYWLYPLTTLNLFEIAYWFLLAYGVADATGLSFKRSFGLVMSSYGVGLLLWIILIMFLTVTYS